jgi:hypothetical protein
MNGCIGASQVCAGVARGVLIKSAVNRSHVASHAMVAAAKFYEGAGQLWQRCMLRPSPCVECEGVRVILVPTTY